MENTLWNGGSQKPESSSPVPEPPQGEPSPYVAFLQRLGRFIVAHNPLYLLSATCMVLGLFLLVREMRHEGTLQIHIVTMASTEAYQLLAGVMCVLLARWRKERRDAGILLGIVAVFFSGSMVLEHGFFAWEVGGPVATISTVLAIVKFFALISLLRLPFTKATLLVSLALHLLNANIPSILEAFTNPAPYTKDSLYERLPVVLAWLWLIPPLICVILLVSAFKERGQARMESLRQPFLGSWVTPWWWTLLALAGTVGHLFTTSWTYELPQFPWPTALALTGMAIVVLELCIRFSRHWLPIACLIPLMLIAGSWSAYLPVHMLLAKATAGIDLSFLQAALLGVAALYLGLSKKHGNATLLILSLAVSSVAVMTPGGERIPYDILHPSWAAQAYIVLLMAIATFLVKRPEIAVVTILAASCAGISGHSQLGIQDIFPIFCGAMVALFTVGMLAGSLWLGKVARVAALLGLTAAPLFSLPSPHDVPARIAVLCIALVLVGLVWTARKEFLVLMVLACPVAAMIGSELVRRQAQAGVVLIICAFVLLAIGFGVSLLRRGVVSG